MTQMSELLSVLIVNAIRVPSGDHSGCAAAMPVPLLLVNWVTCPVAISTTLISPSQHEVNAMRVPSGDQAGSEASSYGPPSRPTDPQLGLPSASNAEID